MNNEIIEKLNHVLKMNSEVMTSTGIRYIEQIIKDLSKQNTNNIHVTFVTGGDEKDAELLSFGVDYEELRDGGVGSYSTAIIKLKNGEVLNIPVERIKFKEIN